MGMVVDCAAYAGGTRVADLDIDQIEEVLRHEGQFVWLGLYEPDQPLLDRVQRAFGLHDLAVEDALRAHQRPKLEEYGDSLFVVLRTAQCDGDGEIAYGETHLFAGPNYIVSIRHGASLPYTPVRHRCECAPKLLAQGPGFVLYAIMDFVVDEYFPIVDALEDGLAKVEQTIFDGQLSRETTERIYNMKTDLVSVKRAIAPLIEVCNRLVRFGQGLIAEETRLYFRDVYDHVIRINEAIDGLRELVTSALEANLSLVSVRQNEVMKKLGGWAAILAVPTLIAGIYGMNFQGMPELGWAYGYPVSLAIMIAASGILYTHFKRNGWL